ncbi:hypothetical protein [Glycomyces paridis]|uniref:DUF308 domain-containing protein n=1 Tax=Glycomyces paridis TaxID=2126555 RepID=A0A4S8NWC6_9ACTN|nr:hypothetical protein [Glycomyces paridis]THV21758.1 hypothetical protein E9998_24210 [Glycomyces paridis]
METFTAPDRMSAGMRRNGVMICAFFGLGWYFGGAGVLPGAGYLIGFAIALAVSVGLVVAIPRIESTRGPRELPKDWGKRYGIWVAFEVVLIVAAIATANALDLVDFLPGTVAVIVGLHFVPLARAFDEPTYKLTGYAMALAGAGGIAGGFAGVGLGGAIAGFGSALVLWATGFVILKRG